MSSTSTSQGNPVYKILCGLHKNSGNSLIHKVFGNTIVTMAMPCLTHVPKLSHLYAQLHINIIHPRKYEEISWNNKGGVIRTRNFEVFRKMWLPSWQCLVLPKLSHLYAQLHINIIHPRKYEEISLNNKGGVIRTIIFKVFRKMWLPWQCLVLPKLSHLYAQLHINIIHPCKYQEISLNNKGGIIRTRIFSF